MTGGGLASGRTRAPGGTRASGTARAIAALAPVRAHLLREARTEADRISAAARAEADAMRARARDAAASAVEQARAQGEADASTAAEATRSRGRARARSVVLGAQREMYEELRRRVQDAAGGLRDDPGYPALLARLTGTATRVAGPGATVSYPPAGGVVARSGQVLVDCSLPALARQAVQALGDRVRELWEQ